MSTDTRELYDGLLTSNLKRKLTSYQVKACIIFSNSSIKETVTVEIKHPESENTFFGNIKKKIKMNS